MGIRLSQWILLALFVLGSLGMAWMLVPGEREMALIHLRGKQYDLALQEYQKLEAEELMSTDTVKALTELYLQRGEVDQAAALMESYVRQHPSDLLARQRLGVLYLYAQRTTDYRLNLEGIYQLQRDEPTMRQLVDLYSARADSARQIGMLRALIESFPGRAQDYLDLVYLLAREQRFDQAVDTMSRFEQLHPEEVTARTIDLALNIQLDSGDHSGALRRARRWLTDHPNPFEASHYANLLSTKADARLGLLLLLVFEQEAERVPELLVELVNLEIEAGQCQEAYQRMVRLAKQQRLPAPLLVPFVELGLADAQLGKVMDLLDSNAGPALLPPWLQSGLVDAVITRGKPRQARLLLESLPRSYLQRRPLDGVALALASGEIEAALDWADTLVAETLSPDDALSLAGIYHRAGRQLRALEVLGRHRDRSQTTRLLTLDLLEGSLAGNLPDWRRSQLKRELGQLANKMIAAPGGDETLRKRLLYPLIEYDLVSDPALSALLELALEQGGNWANAYQQAISGEGREKELAEFWIARAAGEDVSPEERRTAVYALVELGHPRQAARILFPLVKDHPADSNQVTDLIQLWGSAPPEEGLLWLRERSRASTGHSRVAWLRHLALVAGLEAALAQAKLDLPLPSPGEPVRRFVLDGLVQTSQWHKLPVLLAEELTHQREPARLLEIGKLALAAGDPALAEHAFQLVLVARAGGSGVRLRSPQGTRPYETATTHTAGTHPGTAAPHVGVGPQPTRPHISAAAEQLGRLAYSRGEFSRARSYLETALQSGAADPESRYLFGEILLNQGETARARSEFHLALEEIDATDSRAPRLTALRAQLLHRTGKTRRARRILRNLLAEHPDDLHLRADLAAMLLETGALKEAEVLLAFNRSGDLSQEGATRLDLLAAARETRVGQADLALKRLRQLALRSPEQTPSDLLAALANAEMAAGRWRSARSHAQSALSQNPTNESLFELRRNLLAEQAPRANITFRRQDGGRGLFAQVAGAGFEIPLSSEWRFAAGHKVASAAQGIPLIKGEQSRSRLTFRLDRGRGQAFDASLLFGKDSTGGSGLGGRFSWLKHTPRVGWNLSFGIREPYWEIAEGILRGASRDRAELMSQRQISHRLHGWAKASFNAYRFHEPGEQLQTAGLQSELSYALGGSRIRTTFHYSLDAEYILGSETTATDALLRREVHTPALSIAGSFSQKVLFGARVGYSWDRLGGSGITFGAHLGCELTDGLSGQLSYDQSLDTANAGSSLGQIHTRVVWRF